MAFMNPNDPNYLYFQAQLQAQAGPIRFSGNGHFLEEFEIGDEIEFKNGYRNGDVGHFDVNKTPASPIHGQSYFKENKGVVFWASPATDWVSVDFIDRQNNLVRLDFHKNDLTNMKRKAKKAPPKPIKIDESKLDPLIIDLKVKEEILAVLKQHEHSSKLFEEWGLGDVIEYGKGMTLLFYGNPGTGKTWATHCIAKAMGREVLSIGAADIQSQEPGGANRNIVNAFSEVKKSGKVLFIDECDSLITSRSEVGMIIGSEINTLLTEIEKCEGVVILATNRIENMDEALERRISLIVEFPEPNFEQREQIWKKMLPKKMPIEAIVTPKKLAEYKLTGGQIKNVVLQAARLALADNSKEVKADHFVKAVERILKSKNLMGTANRYREGLIQSIGIDKRRTINTDIKKT